MSRRRLAIVIRQVCMLVLLPIAIIFATSGLPENWREYDWLAWPAVFVLLIIVMLLWQDKQAGIPPPVSSNRQPMLYVIRKIWIDGYLQDFFHGLPRIQLGLEEKPLVVCRPFDSIVQPSDRARQRPLGQTIGAIFDELGQGLLILGARGAGKTGLLLELARDLLDRAEQDANHPMPVPFRLTTWAVRRQPLTEWLIDELRKYYRISPRLARAWIEADQVLPLLDGLDEVAPAYRTACVEAINDFRRLHGLVPLAVCCSTEDYEALAVRLELSGAVEIKSLSHGEISTYLKQAGESLAGMWTVLQDDEALWKLLNTPLMLRIVALAYHGKSPTEVRAIGVVEERRAHLFAAYIDAMFKHRTKTIEYTQEQTIQWLSWLARSLILKNESVFYVERMQPDWLPSRVQRWIVAAVEMIIHVGLIVGLLVQLLGLLVGLLAGLIPILFLFVHHDEMNRIVPAEALQWSWKDASISLAIGLAVGLAGGLAAGLNDELNLGLSRGLTSGLAGGLTYWLAARLTFGRAAGLGFGRSGVAAAGLAYRLGVGLFHGLVVGLTLGRITEPVHGLIGWLVPGLYLGLFLGLVLGFIWGFEKEQVEIRTVPNEGIRRSLRNALKITLAIWLLFGLFIGLTIWLSFWLTIEPIAVLIGGLLIGLSFGGFDFLKHYVLRFLLWHNDCAPFNYIRFLDYAAERAFLLKVGGGYSFTHPLVMKYFATLDQRGLGHAG